MDTTSPDSQRLATSNPLTSLWDSLIRGRLRPVHEHITRDSVVFVGLMVVRSQPLYPHEAFLLRSILCGEPRKALAGDLGIAVSTVTGRYLRTLANLDLRDCTMPLVVVLAAQSREAQERVPSARTTYVDHQGCRWLSVSVPLPVTACLSSLTPMQQQVAQGLIEGGTRETIAGRRTRSVHTVAGQVHAVFHALRVTGRFPLVRRACELGCFSQPAVSVA